jgi:Ca2+/Na+ antiporter
MSKRQILILLGVWVMILFYTGFPDFWKWILAIITGLYIIFISYSLKSEVRKEADEALPFIEHKSTNKDSTGDKIADAEKLNKDSIIGDKKSVT